MRLRVAAFVAVCLSLPVARAQTHTGWVATWATANMPLASGPAQRLPIGKQDVTLRQVVHISQGGKRLRVAFTNEFGSTPLHIAAVHVAFLSAGSKILPATDRVLTFGGHADITIAAGAFASSDAVKETVPIYSDLVISAAVPAQSLPGITYHSVARATTFIAAGDQTAAQEFNSPTAGPPGFSQPDVVAPLIEQTTSWYFLKDVEVNSSLKSGAIVAFGDSITDGVNSTPETNRRYPDALAALLGAGKKTGALAVLNVGISGNRILREGTGPSALERFDRDVTAQPGARFVILLEGINDIGHNVKAPVEPVTAAEVIDGMKTLVQRAHSKGLRIFAGTLLPCGGSAYGDAGVEAMRLEINAFLLQGNAFDNVIDFDKAVRDPQHPERMLTRYDSGDHLHPSDPGYAAMAAAVDLKLFVKKK